MTLFDGAMKYLFRPLAVLARSNFTVSRDQRAAQLTTLRQPATVKLIKNTECETRGGAFARQVGGRNLSGQEAENRLGGITLSPVTVSRIFIQKELAQAERSEKLAFAILGLCGLWVICHFLAAFF